MVPALRGAATLRMDTAAAPSASATSRAARTICLRDNDRGWTRRRRSGRAQINTGLGSARTGISAMVERRFWRTRLSGQTDRGAGSALFPEVVGRLACALMAFRGWPVEAIEFYEGLEADNSKAYWQDHKSVYEQCVQRPMKELLAELAPEFGEGKIFRPYRDVRFSADKSPYKTAIAATLGTAGDIPLAPQ